MLSQICYKTGTSRLFNQALNNNVVGQIRNISKSVPIILTQNVEGVGQIGEEMAVTKGYARNFFFMKGYAVPATHESRKKYEEYSRNIDYGSRRSNKEEQSALKKLKKNNLILVMRKPNADGSAKIEITTDNISYSLKRRKSINIEPKDITPEGPIDQFGNHNVNLLIGETTVPIIVKYEAMINNN
ncbi:hypothetical protein PPL_04310 [Heterostelium album PN500]|uniref:Ribosomal protein L9 domain-containing protein n=1 Tax=Heterostelium pallidum (strain ATCC 26659 / Pp 5 / PN500) TaxID=670386 RepID=D3B775_HETP5|nr:hypothetical protein PPL_04310 [Heterostelium album PN500]EFA82618.1 hypothetical protein PPL_04310 [Heterostelium album PN500]|eukprot:XP_020434735.1 hypothetical protein PPL_04310 [Heterostelium album PN500]